MDAIVEPEKTVRGLGRPTQSGQEEWIMLRNITVIGGGGTGYAATAYLTRKGFRVTLCDNERFTREMEDIREQGGLT